MFKIKAAIFMTAAGAATGSGRGRNNGPALDNDPPLSAPEGSAQSMAVVRRPNNILDRDASGFLADFEEVHAGGALPNLFPTDAKVGDYEIVRYLSHEVVLQPDKKKGNKTFVSLKFEVLDEKTGKVTHKAQQVCNTVIQDYFGIECDADGEVIHDAKTMQAKGSNVRDPKATPLLQIIYAGEGQQGTSGFSKPKLFIITELRPKKKTK